MFPFKLPPKQDFVNVGDEQSGIIEVSRYNDLTIAEQLEYDEKVALLGSESKPVIDLIKKVAKDKQLSFDQAQRIILGNEEEEIKLPAGKNAKAIKLEYSEDIFDLNLKMLPIQQEKQIIGASIMVRRTKEPLEAYLSELESALGKSQGEEKEAIEAKIEEYKEQLEKLPNWTVEDSKAVFRLSMIKYLYEFFLKESNNRTMPEVQEVDENTIAEKPTKTIEEMGKPAAIDIEARPVNSGEKFSGESKAIGPTILVSTMKTSSAAPVP